MADSIRKVSDFAIEVANRPGEAFRVFSTLVSAGVNLLACSGVSKGRRSYIYVVPADSRRFKSAVKKAGMSFSPQRTGFLIQGEDREGALAQHLERLSQAQINVTAVDALAAGDGRWGAIIWVDAGAAARAARQLGARTTRPA